MADRSPGKPPPGTDGSKDVKPKVREHRRRSLRDRVTFFETVWWGRNRSPSIEREEPILQSEGDDNSEVKEKIRRRPSVSPTRRKNKSFEEEQSSIEEWEWVEKDGNSSLADIIEKRIQERKKANSGSNTPIEWQKAEVTEDRASLAAEIERRLEKHREEVKTRLSTPQKDWLLQSPLRRAHSRDGSPSVELRSSSPYGSTQSLYSSRDFIDKSGKRSLENSREDVRLPSKKLVKHTFSKAEREEGKLFADVTTTTITSSWGEEGASPVTEIRRSHDILDEDDPSNTEGTFQSLEEDEKETIERGSSRRYERRLIRKSVEKTVEKTPILSFSSKTQVLITGDDVSSPSESSMSEDIQNIKPKQTFGSKPKLRSRTPSVERILEEEESVSMDTGTEDSLLNSISPTHSMLDSGDQYSMEAVTSIKVEKSPSEVKKYSTKVTIREHSPNPAYNRYLLSTRTISKDSLLQSSTESQTGQGLLSWTQKFKDKDIDEKDDRDTNYQDHISLMRGEFFNRCLFMVF